MSNDLVLTLETATRGGSLAIARGELLLASATGPADESHSVNLLSRIESLLSGAGVTLRDIDIFAVAAGPGSFTGLRIGLATMKAFAAVFNKPCVGVPTLEAIALAGGSSRCSYALLPAGRGEVFAQMFKEGVGLAPAVHLPPKILLEEIDQPYSIHWVGPGAHLHKELIRQRANALGIAFVDDQNSPKEFERDQSKVNAEPRSFVQSDVVWTIAPDIEQLAEFVAVLAQRRAALTYPAEALRAIYVRPSDAELRS